MNRTILTALIAAAALGGTAVDARAHRMAGGSDDKARAATRDLNAQQLASANGGGSAMQSQPASAPSMASDAGPAMAPPADATTADPGMTGPVQPADAGAAPADSTTPPR